ncbi:hypothetical protein GDO81_003236 [Engystomops pustulosus]|uniref:Uncharacterized protein n=1 Tax=Engystomops pustulosus TaxID=76066 RepID=A0AAV6ZYH0_ENGPU|nr:hypothetical protein GDO81_003236 [Engystomops pustulosus]
MGVPRSQYYLARLSPQTITAVVRIRGGGPFQVQPSSAVSKPESCVWVQVPNPIGKGWSEMCGRVMKAIKWRSQQAIGKVPTSLGVGTR